jgi:hypothetical protein
MEQKWNYEVGDIVKMKKQHPCGSKDWKILRVGEEHPGTAETKLKSEAADVRKHICGLTKGKAE